MYANLCVTTAKGKELAAHKVEVRDGAVFVHLDRNEGEDNYAVEGGVLKLAGPVTIRADW